MVRQENWRTYQLVDQMAGKQTNSPTKKMLKKTNSDILVLSNLRPVYKAERKESVSVHLRDT